MFINLSNIITTMVFSIISALIVVPVVFVFNKKIEFDSYLHLLNEEIKWNMDKIQKLPDNIREVSNGSRSWLPAIATNRPSWGYIRRYLSLNLYNNLINQTFWNYINDGSTGQLSELFYWFDIYNYLIQRLQVEIHETKSFTNYNEYYFYNKEVSVDGFNRRYTLFEVKKYIEGNYSQLETRFEDINLYKKKKWWRPEPIKDFFE